MQRVYVWSVIENIFTLLIACGLATGFYYYTGSPHSFWWLLLLGNLNRGVKIKGS